MLCWGNVKEKNESKQRQKFYDFSIYDTVVVIKKILDSQRRLFNKAIVVKV